jgi:hypothetical protein
MYEKGLYKCRMFTAASIRRDVSEYTDRCQYTDRYQTVYEYMSASIGLQIDVSEYTNRCQRDYR